IDRVPSLGPSAAVLRQQMADARLAARLHPRTRRGRPSDRRLDLARPELTGASARRQRRILQLEAAPTR
ncbi:MAG: hypothetical protein WA731_14020, partial [Pseudonocardiaceae bacterium]